VKTIQGTPSGSERRIAHTPRGVARRMERLEREPADVPNLAASAGLPYRYSHCVGVPDRGAGSRLRVWPIQDKVSWRWVPGCASGGAPASGPPPRKCRIDPRVDDRGLPAVADQIGIMGDPSASTRLKSMFLSSPLERL